MRAIVEGDLFLSARSSSFLLLLSLFFSHSESCLKVKFLVGKGDVLGEGEKKKENEKKKEDIFEKNEKT